MLPRVALLGWDLEQGKARVFVVDEGGVARSRSITTGLAVGDRVEVSAGLTDSSRVVVRGGFNLREGDRVREAHRKGGADVPVRAFHTSRPVLATVMMLALVILGLFSYRHLNIDMYPDVEIPS